MVRQTKRQATDMNRPVPMGDKARAIIHKAAREANTPLVRWILSDGTVVHFKGDVWLKR